MSSSGVSGVVYTLHVYRRPSNSTARSVTVRPISAARSALVMQAEALLISGIDFIRSISCGYREAYYQEIIIRLYLPFR